MTKQNSLDNNVSLKTLIESFVTQLVGAVETHTTKRVQAALWTALGASGPTILPRRRGRPPKNPTILLSSPLVAESRTPARKRPKQLCPVPGCANVAAPVFGMVCSKHKKVAKSVIGKYRAERRAANASKSRSKAA
jgi:hypothetical protein